MVLLSRRAVPPVRAAYVAIEWGLKAPFAGSGLV